MIDSARLPFPKGSTKLDRAVKRKVARLTDKKLLDAWALAVKTRDCWKDRKTGARVYRTRALDPRRADAHHIVSKDDWAVRYDVRNGVTLSAISHDAVERHHFRIVGTVWFWKKGQRYIDATFPVRFIRG